MALGDLHLALRLREETQIDTITEARREHADRQRPAVPKRVEQALAPPSSAMRRSVHAKCSVSSWAADSRRA
jgi:hypothetical protein